MSTVKINNVQIGQSVTAANNFTLAVPASPNGTMKLSRGNQGATTQDIITVDASGNVNIVNGLLVNGTPLQGGSGTGAIISDISTDATYYPAFTSATSGSMSIANIASTKLTYNPNSGILSSILFNTTSDLNKKTNVTTASADLIDMLRGVEFNWKDSGEKSSGVVAQEVLEVLPHLVGKDENGLNVNYNGLVAYLIEAVKELRTEVAFLKNEHTSVK